ncbi:hypothetical protein G5I_10652 [Acromyrmex echinatior]|uniref:Uncharacterized protein n=1 Tax=Acromyrmex echinatior TaxID=103372 RepID=F4WXG7_ACREC|nr:hypothetical protein G5I_10652 [Acromyrmex echinatior]
MDDVSRDVNGRGQDPKGRAREKQFRADARNCFKEELPVRALDLDRKTSESIAREHSQVPEGVSSGVCPKYRTNEQTKQDKQMSKGRR